MHLFPALELIAAAPALVRPVCFGRRSLVTRGRGRGLCRSSRIDSLAQSLLLLERLTSRASDGRRKLEDVSPALRVGKGIGQRVCSRATCAFEGNPPCCRLP